MAKSPGAKKTFVAKVDSPKKRVKTRPAQIHYSGDKDCAIYLVQANIQDRKGGHLDLKKLKHHVSSDFSGANLTFLHTPVEWSATDVFSMAMNIKLMNRSAGLDTYLVLVGCGITNVNLFKDALYRHTIRSIVAGPSFLSVWGDTSSMPGLL